MKQEFGDWICGDLTFEQGLTLIRSDYDVIETHVRKFVEKNEMPGEFALRFWSLAIAKERFEAVRLSFFNGVMVLLPQVIDGDTCYVAWTVVSEMQLFVLCKYEFMSNDH
jgi:hypothetical protein